MYLNFIFLCNQIQHNIETDSCFTSWGGRDSVLITTTSVVTKLIGCFINLWLARARDLTRPFGKNLSDYLWNLICDLVH